MGLTKYLWSPLTSHTTTGLEATTHFQNSIPTSSVHAGKIPTALFPCRGQLRVTMAQHWVPQLHSTPIMEPSSWPQGLFSICGASAYMHLPSRAEGKMFLGLHPARRHLGQDHPQCPIKESTSRLEHGGHQAPWPHPSPPSHRISGMVRDRMHERARPRPAFLWPCGL